MQKKGMWHPFFTKAKSLSDVGSWDWSNSNQMINFSKQYITYLVITTPYGFYEVVDIV